MCILISPSKLSLYRTWINSKKTYVFIGMLALFCAAVCCPIFTPKVTSSWNSNSYTCGPDFFANLDYFAAYCFFTFPLPIIIVIVSYVIIFSVRNFIAYSFNIFNSKTRLLSVSRLIALSVTMPLNL